MQIKIGVTGKRVIETGATNPFISSTTLDCKLKEPCSMQAPIFKVQGLTKGVIYNYAQFEGRFYWIDDIIYLNRHIQEVQCHLDPIATYKQVIRNTHAFVKYGDKANWDEYADDTRFNPEELFSSAENSADAFGVSTDHYDPTLGSAGTFIVKVMEFFDNTDHNGVKTYAMSPSSFAKMLCDLGGFFDSFGTSWTGTIKEILQFASDLWGSVGGAGSWRDNILGVRYTVIPLTEYQNRSGISQQYGMYVGGVLCAENEVVYRMSPVELVRHNASIGIPKHQQLTSKYKFLRNPRFSSMQLITPGGNFTDIDISMVKDLTSVGWYSTIDINTGNWTGKLVAENVMSGQVLATASGTIGMDVLELVGTGMSQSRIFASNAMRAASYGMSGFSSIQSGSGNKTDASSWGDTYSSGHSIANTTGNGMTQYSGASNVNSVSSSNLTTKTSSYSTGVQGSFLPNGLSLGTSSGSFGDPFLSFFLYKDSEKANRGKVFLRYVTYAPHFMINGSSLNDKYDDYCAQYGYPVNAFLPLSSVNGYCCCVGACVELPAPVSPSNQSTLNSFINTGVYLTPTS